MGLSPLLYRDQFLGRDIYVLGSGPSLNHLSPRFFDGKIVVGANHGCMKVVDTATYIVTKYHRHAEENVLRWPTIPMVVPRHNSGQWSQERMRDDAPFIVVDTNDNPCERFTGNDWPDDPDALVASWSTITTAMHWAAYLGARNIVLAGHDCGWIDTAGRVPGHRQEADGVTDDDGDSFMWEAFDAQSRIVKAELLRRYPGLQSITSMNPFLNMNIEGHRWRSFAGTLND